MLVYEKSHVHILSLLSYNHSEYEGRSGQTGTYNFTGLKRDASMAVLHAVVKWQVCPITDRRPTCHWPVQRPLIKMADNSVSSCMEQRVVMKFLVNKGIKPPDIYRRLQAQYGDETLSRSKIFEWCKRFKDGRTSVRDDPGCCGSQPTAVIPVNIQHVECLILDNQRITCREIAQETNLSVGMVNTIFHEYLRF